MVNFLLFALPLAFFAFFICVLLLCKILLYFLNLLLAEIPLCLCHMPFFFITKFVISATFVILLTSFLPLEAKTLLFLLYLLTLLLAEGPSFPCHSPFFFSTKFVISAIFPRFVNKLLAVAVKILFIFTIFCNFQLLADGPVCLC